MTTFSVTWTIEIDADTPIEAAYQAWVIQHDPLSTATVFTVNGVDIDLIETIKVEQARHDH